MQLKHLSECRISLETGFSLLASSPPLAVGARSSSTSSQIISNLLCRLMMISPWEQKSSPWLNERLRTMIINKNKNNWLQFSLQTNNKLAFANMPYTNGVGKYTYMCSNVDTHTKVENLNLKTYKTWKMVNSTNLTQFMRNTSEKKVDIITLVQFSPMLVKTKACIKFPFWSNNKAKAENDVIPLFQKKPEKWVLLVSRMQKNTRSHLRWEDQLHLSGCMLYNINNTVNDEVDNLKTIQGFKEQKELHYSKFASTPSADVSFNSGRSNSTSCKPSVEQGSSLTT